MIYGLPYWQTTAPACEYTEAESQEMVAAITDRIEKFRRQVRTSMVLDYCRHRDSPAWREKVADILRRHPQWAHPEANWWN